MLLELKVKNFAIIDELHLPFREGLNILSGETGSGKSVLLKSLGLLMGDKSSADMVRTGESQATIEGSFDLTHRPDLIERLQQFGIETEDSQLIVRRLVSSQDKSKVYLNGSLSTVSQLREIVSPLVEVTGQAAPLIEITGQHENKNLLSKNYHLDLLDHHLNLFTLRSKFQANFERARFLKAEISKLEQESSQKAQRLDFLCFQRDEIVNLDMAPGEDEGLETEIRRMKNFSKIGQTVESIEALLSTDEDSALQRIRVTLKKGLELRQLDPSLEKQFEKLEQSEALISDFLFETQKSVSSIDFDPQKLETLEAKLSQFRKLQKKYGSDLHAILRNLVEIENEIARLESSDLSQSKMKKELEQLFSEMKKMGQELHAKREKGSQSLAASVNDELLDLNMKGVTFHVLIEKCDDFRLDGQSSVEFMCRTSIKDPLRPLSKTASGGELSRILLSLKKILGVGQYPRTYLFDEVDAGVSGPTAEKVGKKLRTIAQHQQVICVTHLPQVAAFGSHHFYIEKETKKDRVFMKVTELTESQKIAEIARLISGEKVTPSSLSHAKELLNQSQIGGRIQ
jgi:DNA repair protein RecN (Recombination protein N)